jgi:transcriptional regulator with XRE-family HTH domain
MKCHYLQQATLPATLYTVRMTLRIKELRDEKGWTQETLASKAGISRSQLAMIEKGTRPANTLRLDALAAALGVQTDALFARSDEDYALLQIVKRLSPDDRAVIVRMAEALAAKADQD